MSVAELYWIAGLLEGEGRFGFDRGVPSIVVAMSDEDIVKRVASIFGSDLRGPQRRMHTRKDVWVTSVHGGKAISLMMSLFPLLGRRRQTRVNEIFSRNRRAREQGSVAGATA